MGLNWYVYGRNRNDDLTLVDMFPDKKSAETFCEQWGWFYDDGERWSLYIDVDVSEFGSCSGSTSYCEDTCPKYYSCDTIVMANMALA